VAAGGRLAKELWFSPYESYNHKLKPTSQKNNFAAMLFNSDEFIFLFLPVTLLVFFKF
jgi:hypothetical protein